MGCCSHHTCRYGSKKSNKGVRAILGSLIFGPYDMHVVFHRISVPIAGAAMDPRSPAKRSGKSYLNSTLADDKGECPSGKMPCSQKTTGMNTICIDETKQA